MNYNNSKFSIWLPIIIALSLVVGIVISQVFDIKFAHYQVQPQSSGNKIQDVLNLINTFYVDDLPNDSIEDIMISDFLHNLDPHSSYFTAKETKEAETELTGNFVGIGIRFYLLRDSLMITNIIKGGAAEKVHLSVGDRILEVDGKQMCGVGLSNDSVRGRILGKSGEKIKLKVLHNGKEREITFYREPVDVESVYFSKIGNIGYIKIISYSDNTLSQFDNAVFQLKQQNVKSLVLDLRDNGGGYMHIAAGLLDYFMKDRKLLVYTQGANVERQEIFSSGRNGLCAGLPLAVLVNENSASASEITAGVIQDYDLGTVIGNVTFGKGLVQRTFNLNDGSSLRLTISRYYLPSGRCIQRSYKDGYISYLENFYLNYGKNKQQIDSTKVFYTLNKKRQVFEGDGIMPDITIEHDTSYITELLTKISRANIISDFCVDYFDKNRKILNENKIDTEEKLRIFLKKDKLVEKFFALVNEKSIEYTDEEYTKSLSYIEKVLYYQVASYCLDLNTSQRFLLDGDLYFEKAKQVLQQ